MSIRTVFLALTMSTAATFAFAHGRTPEATLVELFCAQHGSDQHGYGYLVTASLLELIDKAQAKNDEIQAAAPDEKPPLGDGILFQSYPDMAPVCKQGAFGADGIVEVQYEFPETPDANWTDRLKLVTESGLVKIDDVLYGKEGVEGLRKVLDGVLKAAQ
ncbi:MAG TPA: hypothetical protein VMF90_25945 [Rhizobiaceae bacterium]|nr:hypothetical protein [Rhizobiaceae bacterium]